MLLKGAVDRGRPYKWQSTCDLPKRPPRYGGVVRSGRRSFGRYEMTTNKQQGIDWSKWAAPTVTICIFMVADGLHGGTPSLVLVAARSELNSFQKLEKEGSAQR